MRRVVPAVMIVVLLAVAVTALCGCTANASSAALQESTTAAPASSTQEPVVSTTQAPEPPLVEEPEPEPVPESVVLVTPATVVRVVDGDTAVFRLADGTEEKVRFIGVDTPESTTETEAYGKEASAYTAKALPEGTAVLLEKDAEERDRYGRLLAYVWLTEPTALTEAELRNKMFNAKLAGDGYAQQMTIQPNSKYAEYFTTFVAEARNAERGLWSPDVAGATAAASAPKTAPKVAPKPKPKATPSDDGGTVYITDTGEKYHSGGCSYLRTSKHATSRSDAEAQGYTPCSRCDP